MPKEHNRVHLPHEFQEKKPQERQTSVFFATLNPMEDAHVYWYSLKRGQEKGLQFCRHGCISVVLSNTLLAGCIEKAVGMCEGELHQNVRSA